MNCLFWNCRGLGNPATIRQLTWLAKNKKPKMVFLMETKLMKEEWGNILFKAGFDNMFAVSCDRAAGGRKGGLGLLWMDELEVSIMSSSLHIFWQGSMAVRS